MSKCTLSLVKEKKAQFWLFTDVAFEVFVCLHMKNFRKAESCEGDIRCPRCPDSRCHLVRAALVPREEVEQGRKTE